MSNLWGQISEPEEVSNKVRAGRIWSKRGSGLWYGSGHTVQDRDHESYRSDRALCYLVPAREDRVRSDSFKQWLRKGQRHLLNRIFRVFPSFCSLSLLTVIFFWCHFPLLMHIYWASFTDGLATQAEKSCPAALASTSRNINSPFYLISHQLASLFLLPNHLETARVGLEVVQSASPKLT